jgi:hypothetical protein
MLVRCGQKLLRILNIVRPVSHVPRAPGPHLPF